MAKRVPKETLFRRAGGGKAIRTLYDQQVDRVEWAFKLFERSVNLPPTPAVAEIQVLRLHLRGSRLDERVLAHVDKALPHPTWFELLRPAPDGTEVQVAAAYKRRSDADSTQIVRLETSRTDWAPAIAVRAALPSAVSLEGLYGGLLRSLWPHPQRPGESLRAHAERLSAIATQAKAVERLRVVVRREADFARQVERNRELRVAEVALKKLTDPT